MKTRTVELRERGIEIAYDRAGPCDGRAFVLVHGFTGSCDDFAEQLRPLSALGPTLALDQRGHGGSTNTGDEAHYTLETLVTDLGAALSALGIDRCDLLGHSMGGMVALRYALDHPERVDSLVLMDTADGPVRGLDPQFGKAIEIAKAIGMEGLAKLMKARAEEDPTTPASVRAVRERMGPERWWARIEAKLAAMDPAAFAGLGTALSKHTSVRERLGEIRVPTLVLVGEEDLPFREVSSEMADTIADAVLAVIPNGAHSPQFENPPAWFDAVRGHLARARG